MLTDPLKIAKVTSTTTDAGSTVTVVPSGTADCSITAYPSGGTQRKVTAGPLTQATMTISHSTSKENAPFVTGRHVVRLDRKVQDVATGRLLNLSAYMVVSLPEGSVNVSVTDAITLVNYLCSLLLFGEVEASGNFLDVDGNLMQRLLSGES